MENFKLNKKIKGFTASAFDLLHYGHIIMLEECKQHCDYLIVGVQTDPSVDRTDKNKPIQTLEERIGQVKAIKYVDEIVLYDTEEDLYNILKKIDIDVRILGEDWKGKPFTGHDLPLKTVFNSRNHGYSTSELKQRIIREEHQTFANEMFSMQKRMDKIEEEFFYKMMFLLTNECDDVHAIPHETLINNFDLHHNSKEVPGRWDFDYENQTLVIDECNPGFTIKVTDAKNIDNQLGFDLIMIVFNDDSIQPVTISCKSHAENA